MPGNIRRAPKFIRAKSEEDLHQKIIDLQLATHREYSFISIYPLGRGIVAWYYDEDDTVTALNVIAGLLNGKKL
jgi:hypothetical protein